MAAGPFARILAQFVLVAGGAVVRSVMTAYKEAASRGASNPTAQSVKTAMSRRMSPDEAAKILEIELAQASKEQVAQRFDALYKANQAADGYMGSPYIQRKVSNSNTVLQEYLKQRLESQAGKQ
jgi:hypothetical protein